MSASDFDDSSLPTDLAGEDFDDLDLDDEDSVDASEDSVPRLTIGNLLDTAAKMCETAGSAAAALLRVPVASDDYEDWRKQKLDSDKFFLIFTSREHIDPQDLPPTPGFDLLVIQPNTPSVIGPLLSFVASAVVLLDEVEEMEQQLLYSLFICASRGLPIMNVGEAVTPDHEFFSALVNYDVPTLDQVIPTLDKLIPTSRFPFTITQEGTTWALTPLAPYDFITDAPVGSPRFQGVLSRMMYLVGRAKTEGKLKSGTRYYACFVGDMCMSIIGDEERRVVSLLDSGAAPVAAALGAS